MFLITYGKSQCDWTSLMPKNAYTVKQKKKENLEKHLSAIYKHNHYPTGISYHT